MYRVPSLHAASLQPMQDAKQEQLEWVKAVMDHLGVRSKNALAVIAGVEPSLIQKPFNPNYKGKFGADTLKKIADAAHLRVMEFPGRPGGLGEGDASPFVYNESENTLERNFDRAVRELTAGRNGRDAWVMGNHSLELSGVMPGDVLIVDMNLAPRPRDIVCAQLYDNARGRADTVFRIYDPPFLLVNSIRLGPHKGLMVDNDQIAIRGVVDAVLRRRTAAA